MREFDLKMRNTKRKRTKKNSKEGDRDREREGEPDSHLKRVTERMRLALEMSDRIKEREKKT